MIGGGEYVEGKERLMYQSILHHQSNKVVNAVGMWACQAKK